MGRVVSAARHQRGQAALDAHTAQCPLAENHPRPSGVGGHAQTRRLSPRPVRAPEGSAWSEESHRRGGGLHADRRLCHASRWRRVPGSRQPVLHGPRQSRNDPTPPPSVAKARRQRRNQDTGGLTEMRSTG